MNHPATTSEIRKRSQIFSDMRMQDFLAKVMMTLVLGAGAILVMLPLLFMMSTALKDRNQLRTFPPPLIPSEQIMVMVDDKEEPLYRVMLDGQTLEMALIRNLPQGNGMFVDPANPEESFELVIAEQEAVRQVEIHWENFEEALTAVPFSRYLRNTMTIVTVTLFGTLLSCSVAAYGFARFRAPGLNVLFFILLGTIMLPSQVTMLPTYVMFEKLGWIDTLKPLIVPSFFGNAFNIFLLRQFFMTIPRDLDEAAEIDGANRLQILFLVILPQAKSVLAALSVFHFLYTWNDFFEPLIYLHSQENWTIAIGLQTFSALYSVNTHLIMAASLVMIIPPIVLFFLAQRVFMQGIVVTGVKG